MSVHAISFCLSQGEDFSVEVRLQRIQDIGGQIIVQ